MKKPLALLLIIFAALSALACKNAGEDGYSFTTATFTYSEPHSEIYTSYGGYSAKTEHADYYFVNSVSKEHRNGFINAAEELLNHVNPQKGLSYYVSYQFYPRADSLTLAIFAPASAAKSIDLISLTLLAIYGEYTNYGLIYGTSAKILGELGWGSVATKSNNEIKEYLAVNNFIPDLNYAVFNEKLASNTDIDFARSLAVGATLPIDDYWQVLGNDTLFYGYLSDYLDTLGIEWSSDNAVLLKAAPYTRDFPLKITTPYCELFMHKDWEETDIPRVMPNLNFEFNYANVKEYLCRAQSFLANAREFFDYSDNSFDYYEFKRLPVLLKWIDDYAGLALREGIVYLRTLIALTHEYTHILTFDRYNANLKAWQSEGIAHYVEYLFDEYLKEVEEYYFNNPEKTNEKAQRIYARYREKYAEFNLINILHCSIYILDLPPEPMDRNLSACLTAYLIENYTKEQYFAAYKNGDYVAAYGKTEDELRAEYFEYLNQMFA